MSKVGEKPLSIPASVQITIQDRTVTVKGSKGEVAVVLPLELEVSQDKGILTVRRRREDKHSRALHGLYRSMIANAVAGVEKEWEKRLEVVGTGFGVKLQGQDLNFKVGYSHQVTFKQVPGVKFTVDGTTIAIVSGVDKQFVGQIAHQIKLIKKPDVYKGKGIRYVGEVVRIKPGKKAKAA